MMHWDLFPGEQVTLVRASNLMDGAIALIFRARDTRSAFFLSLDGKEIHRARAADRLPTGEGKHFTVASGGRR